MNDDELLAGLGRVVAEVDPIPDWVAAAARTAIATRDPDAELATLVGDSAERDQGFEAVRADVSVSRMLTFVGGGVQLDLQVTGQGDRLDLIGQLTGAAADECAVEHVRDERRPLELDEIGRFLVPGVRRGLVRVRCRSATGDPVTTTWVRL